jgi:hypothetical protein
MSRYSDDTMVRTMVRQAGTVLDQLGMRGTFTLDELHRSLERQRGRRIHLIPHPMPPHGPHGMWVMGESDDYVFFDQAAPPMRKLQIIGHEFGHIAFNDEGGPARLEELAGQLMPGDASGVADPDARTLSACTRTVYDDMIEQRCEWFGTVVVQRLNLSVPPVLPAPRPPSDR